MRSCFGLGGCGGAALASGFGTGFLASSDFNASAIGSTLGGSGFFSIGFGSSFGLFSTTGFGGSGRGVGDEREAADPAEDLVLFLFLLLPIGLLLTLRGLEHYERLLVEDEPRRAEDTAHPPLPARPVAAPHRVTAAATIPNGIPVGKSVGMPNAVPPITEPV